MSQFQTETIKIVALILTFLLVTIFASVLRDKGFNINLKLRLKVCIQMAKQYQCSYSHFYSFTFIRNGALSW